MPPIESEFFYEDSRDREREMRDRTREGDLGLFDLVEGRRGRSPFPDKTLSTFVMSRDIASLVCNLRGGRQATSSCDWGLRQ